jgi:hypothetical protein
MNTVTGGNEGFHSPQPSLKKVAVVAVHGISDQKPCESARAIADLLLAHTDPSQSRYTPFHEHAIRIPVAPVQPRQQINIRMMSGWNASLHHILDWILPRKWAEGLYRLWDSADERGPYMRRLLTGKPEDENDPRSQSDYLFLRDQLESYELNEVQPRSVYDSLYLDGCRVTTDPATQATVKTQVHLYEMYWADLSRLGSGFMRIFGELYQLLFHLGSLGRQSVDLLRAEHQTTKHMGDVSELFNIWAWYSATQALATRIFSLLLPILNLYLLIAALSSLPGNLPAAYLRPIASGVIGFLVTVAMGCVLIHRPKASFGSWMLFPVGIGFITALGIKAVLTPEMSPLSKLGVYHLLFIEWIILLGAGIWVLLIQPYSRHRPGAGTFAIVAAIPLGVTALSLLWMAPDSHAGITFVSLRLVEVIYSLLLVSWLAFLLLYFASLVIGKMAISQIPRGDNRRALARQSAWTARFSLSLPAILFSFLTLSLWTALARVAAPLLPKQDYEPLLLFKAVQLTFTPAQFANKLTVFSGSALALVIILAVFLAIGILLWAFGPAILTEQFPPSSKKRQQEQQAQAEFSAGLGNWLSQGFKLIVGPGDWLISGVIPFLFLVGIFDGLSLLRGTSFLATLFPGLVGTFNSTETLLTWVAGLLTASATSLIAFGERLDQLSLGLRGVLDATLDVDNYLRVHPRDDNPTGRIFARYTSLLRYLCQRTKPDGQPYDAIVIVAHSQGTVISADLLRFLAIDPDPALAALGRSIPIHLFTMGSPLRQLYSFAFPSLYHWAINPTAAADTTLAIADKAQPNPQALLGVKTWVNAFRSGDYVGRYLWRSDKAKSCWQRVNVQGTPNYISEDPAQLRREFCLGAGAHTHYWDKTAPEVAHEIDRLICHSMEQPQEGLGESHQDRTSNPTLG